MFRKGWRDEELSACSELISLSARQTELQQSCYHCCCEDDEDNDNDDDDDDDDDDGDDEDDHDNGGNDVDRESANEGLLHVDEGLLWYDVLLQIRWGQTQSKFSVTSGQKWLK